MKRLTFVCMILVGLVSGARAAEPGPAAVAFTPAQRAEIVDVLRAALKTDPSILRDAVAALEADDLRAQAAAAHAAITGASAALLGVADDPQAGDPAGDVTVVEFADLRCPYCHRMVPVIAELMRHDPHLRLVYKDIPILGPASVLGARAVLAAQKQGGYRGLHDALMGSTAPITPDNLHLAATRLKLDWDLLQRDMADPAIQARITANVELAHALAIQGTPAYVIGDRMLSGAVELAALEQAVAAARHVN